jgi:hypothetical protein
MNCAYNVQGFLICTQPSTKEIKENFVENNTRLVQCSKLIHDNDAKQQCPNCCIKNDLLWNNNWVNSNNKSLCLCNANDKIQLLNDTNMIAPPGMLSQMSSHIWSLGNHNINDCVDTCLKDSSCTYFVIDSNNTCWNTDLNPVLAQKTFKSGIISGIKK